MDNKLSFRNTHDYFNELEKEGEKFASLLTVCSEEESTCRARGSETGEIIAFRSEGYSEEEYKAIRAQASEWEVLHVYSETWDPSYCSWGPVREESVFEVSDSLILVKDGNFYGVISYNTQLSGNSFPVYATTEGYRGRPVLFCSRERYGSSDREMFEENNYSLIKKSDDRERQKTEAEII